MPEVHGTLRAVAHTAMLDPRLEVMTTPPAPTFSLPSVPRLVPGKTQPLLH